MTSEIEELITERIRVYPDFPTPGVAFQDLGPLYATPGALRRLAEQLTARFEGRFDLLLGVEARGFVLGAAMATASNGPLLLARKPGKLPGRLERREYTLEYGTAALEVQQGDIKPGQRVLVIDDVLVTGGTLAAAADLVTAAGAQVAGFAVVLDLAGLGGRQRLAPLEVAAAATVNLAL